MHEMNCKECSDWLHAYLDNELDTATAIQLRMHLDGCASCRSQLKSMEVLRKGIQQHTPYHAAPASLQQNILSQIRSQSSSHPVHPFIWLQQWLAPAFSVVALAVAASLYIATPSAMDQLTDEIVASHVRSLMEQHLTDVASSDRHTVKPWFTGKLDFSPPVYDFAAQEYPLLGGRLDYIDHRTVAALSYRHNKHIINLFVTPDTGDDSGIATTSRRGYNLVSWRQNHLAFEAVSDLNSKELQAFGNLIMSQPK